MGWGCKPPPCTLTIYINEEGYAPRVGKSHMHHHQTFLTNFFKSKSHSSVVVGSVQTTHFEMWLDFTEQFCGI